MSQVGILGGGGSGSSPILFLQGNTGGDVGPNGTGEIFLLGTGGVAIAGNPGTNTLTVSVLGGGFTWNDENVSFNAAVSNGYFITGPATAFLPASPSQGDTIIISVVNSAIVFVQANTGQEIVIGSSASSSGGTASITSEGGSVLELVYRAANSTWNTISSVGNWTLA